MGRAVVVRGRFGVCPSPLCGALSAAHAAERDARAAMRDGLRCVADGPARAPDAVQCFERALRSRLLPMPGTSRWRRYALAATWINLASARLDCSQPDDAPAAVQACEAAIAALVPLPTVVDPRLPRRLAIAQHTRGRALLQLGRTADAGTAFAEAIAVLDAPCSRRVADRDYLRAAAWVALADTQLQDGAANGRSRALHSVTAALQLVRGFEAADVRAADVGLRARHVCCRAVADELAAGLGRLSAADGSVHLATDVAEEGLALARRWEERGMTRFQPIARDLFRFGAGVYARYQPQFLDEYLADHA
jgi:hypothetical protein